MRFILSAVLILTASSVYAQCPGGVCPIRGYASQGYASRVYARAYVAPKYATIQPCTPIETVEPCAPIETIQPCEPVATCAPVETVEPCAPVETIQPCEPVETIQPCAPVKTCAPVEAVPEAIVRSGVCPIRRTASTVASFLSRLNAVRARYGLAALKLDATLEAGAQRQAAYCSQTGALIHGNAAEILAQNGSGFDVALDQWLASPAHRALLLGRYTSAGVGVRVDSRGRAWCAVRFR